MLRLSGDFEGVRENGEVDLLVLSKLENFSMVLATDDDEYIDRRFMQFDEGDADLSVKEIKGEN